MLPREWRSPAAAGAAAGCSSRIRERRGRAAQGKAPCVEDVRHALQMRRGDATVSVRHDTRSVDAQQPRVTKTQGAGFLGRRAAPPRVASIIMIRTDAAAPMPTSPPGNRVRSEVGRTPNSATLPQSICYGLPEVETAQILTNRGRREKHSLENAGVA